MAKKQDIIFTPTIEEIWSGREGRAYTALAGANNTGKSLVLKYLKSRLGRTAYFLGPNRFYHVYHISSGIRDPNDIDNFENQFQNQFRDESHNHEQNFLDLNRIIIGLTDLQRRDLFRICGELIGSKIQMRKAIEDNELSPRYIDVDGNNLSVASTGTRLLMTILGICMDERFSTILLDEPELGLGPRVQQALSTFLQDDSARRRIFPQLRQVVVATHSHIFLDRSDFSSNFVVRKSGLDVSVSEVANVAQFHRLQFNLLGNSLETIFFPSAVLIVEGKTDQEYLERLVQLRFPKRRVTVIEAAGDPKKKVHDLKAVMGDIERSPLRSRLFVVVDQVHAAGLREALVKNGVLAENIVCWSKNGIEYLYPSSIVAQIFSCREEQTRQLDIAGDVIQLNGIKKTKNQLKDEVLKSLDAESVVPEELTRALLDPLAAAID